MAPNPLHYDKIMFAAITLSRPETPPHHEEMSIPNPNGGAGMIRAWTYGGYLLHKKFDRVDRNLRELVAQCLCEKPAHRPDLAVLKTTIANHLQAQNWAGHDSDAALTQWVMDNMVHPPVPPGQRQGTHWVDL